MGGIQKRLCAELWVHIKEARVVKINPEHPHYGVSHNHVLPWNVEVNPSLYQICNRFPFLGWH